MKASVAGNQFANNSDSRECYGAAAHLEILEGLGATRKYIPSKYFYDATGSELFEMICELPEYYQTRTELELLSIHASDIVNGFCPGNLVELGSGSNRKVRILLEAIGPDRLAEVCYMPVDVCYEALASSSLELKKMFPKLSVQPLIGDFTRDFQFAHTNLPRLILFFGSTIGNLDEEETNAFLRNVARSMNEADRFMVGLDMVKPVEILEAAYNDSRGVTARFNKNILNVINSEAGADFQPELFDHLAYFNQQHDRIEMHLVAKKDHLVRLSLFDSVCSIKRGETIRTEICRKFRKETAAQMFRRAGMRIDRWRTDQNGWFSLAEVVLA